MYLLVAKQLFIMAMITVAAFIFARIIEVGDKEQKFMSKLLLYFINPCLVFNCFNIDFDLGKLKQLCFVTFIALVIHGVMILVGLISSKEKIDRIGTVFTNCGFVGIPLIRGVFGDEGVFYLMGYLIIFNVLLWTYGYSQISGSVNLKKIITNPNIIAVTLGIIVFCLPFRLPELISRPIAMIGDTNTAMAMVLLGILFANFDAQQFKSCFLRTLKFSLFRLVVCSVVNIALLYVVYRFTGNMTDSRMMLFVVLICSMCPAASSVPGLAVVFDRDKDYASMIVSVTSLLCVLTIPSFVALAEVFIK